MTVLARLILSKLCDSEDKLASDSEDVFEQASGSEDVDEASDSEDVVDDRS